MKKNFNIIQIKGIRGLIVAGFVVTCLIAGFAVFPGWVCMQLWNLFASNSEVVPTIGLFQGLLLWGILVASYLILRKEEVIVCVKSPQGLSEDELKEVLADMKKQAMEDPMYQALMKARESELKIKHTSENSVNESEQVANTDSSKV